ncbi:MAG: CHASE2 domain-containing protein [Rhodoferax sp.]|nr:CHASE2 domain-containing protein [Rhodoferax sp.]
MSFKLDSLLALMQRVFLYRKGRPIALVILLWMTTLNTLSELPTELRPAGSVLASVAVELGAPFNSARQFLFDGYQKRFPRQPQSQPVTIVAIDEASLARVGQWPWPRNRLAQLIDAINQYQPAAIGLDIYMPEEDQTSPGKVADNLPASAKALARRLRALPSHEAQLAESLRSAPSVLGFAGFDYAAFTSSSGLRNAPVLVSGDDPLPYLRRFVNVLASLPVLQAAASGQGLLSVDSENGVIRRIPLIAAVGDQPVASLAMEMLRVASGSQSVEASVGTHGIEAVSVADLSVPTQRGGDVWLHVAPIHSTAHRYLSAVEVLEGRATAEQLSGKLVLLGLTGSGLNDMRTTALGEVVPGIEIQAQLLESFFDGRFLLRPWWMKWLETVGLLCLGLLMVWFVPQTDSLLANFLRAVPRASMWLAVALNLVLISTGYLLFGYRGLLFDAASFFLVLSGVMGSLISSAMIEIDRQTKLLAAEHQRMRDAAHVVAGELKKSLTIDSDHAADTSHERIRAYVRLLAERLAQDPAYASQLPPKLIDTLCLAAPFHDVGMTRVAPDLLEKTGNLTPEEQAIMRQHATVGSTVGNIAVETARQALGVVDDAETLPLFLKLFREAAQAHHERWDGSGYPDGLSGEAIPLAARLVAIADVYDGLVSTRSYRQALTTQEAERVILDGRATLFDPRLVDAFMDVAPDFARVEARLKNLHP